MKTLDRSKPFGEVFGAGAARYEQDHVLFDAQGNALTEAPEPVVEKRRGRKPAEAPASEPSAPESQLDAQLRG